MSLQYNVTICLSSVQRKSLFKSKFGITRNEGGCSWTFNITPWHSNHVPVLSKNPPNQDHSDVTSIHEEYLIILGDVPATRSNDDEYEYIAMEELSESVTDQEKQCSHSNSSNGLATTSGQFAITEHTSQTTDSTHTVLSSRQHSENSSSSSSISDQYLKPISTRSTSHSDESEYEYSDVATTQESTNTELKYIDLGPRPPQRPTVYDRLRHSRLDADS